MDDLISRQAAIAHAISGRTRELEGEKWIRVSEVRESLQTMQSAQPERKKGRWEMKPDPYGFFGEIPVCSECGCTTKMRDKTKFCPNCGADMRGEKE